MAQAVGQGIWLGPGGWLYDYNPMRVGTGGGPYLAISYNPSTKSSVTTEVTNQATKSAILTELSKSGQKVTAEVAKTIRAGGSKTTTTSTKVSSFVPSTTTTTPSGPAQAALLPANITALTAEPWFWPMVLLGGVSLVAGGILMFGSKK